MPEEKVTIEGDMTVRMVRGLLSGMPGTWRLVGQEDGSIIAGPVPRRSREEEPDEEDMDEEEAEVRDQGEWIDDEQ